MKGSARSIDVNKVLQDQKRMIDMLEAVNDGLKRIANDFAFAKPTLGAVAKPAFRVPVFGHHC
eukprot:15479479-Alexandrium_andersonii.AAC.1